MQMKKKKKIVTIGLCDSFKCEAAYHSFLLLQFSSIAAKENATANKKKKINIIKWYIHTHIDVDRVINESSKSVWWMQ